jgi:hypothetical protein
MKDKIIYLALGFFMALSLFLLVASGDDGEAGRYQGFCTEGSVLFILDTQTKDVFRIWGNASVWEEVERNKLYYIPGEKLD